MGMAYTGDVFQGSKFIPGKRGETNSLRCPGDGIRAPAGQAEEESLVRPSLSLSDQ